MISSSLIKEFTVNTAFGGVSIGFIQAAVEVAAQAGQSAPSTFWQGFATLALTSLMTLGKWYFDDRKSSRANAEAIAKLQEQIDGLRKELLEAQKPARRRTR
jgi:hypothetical protein